jgi:hypothetical protein
LSLGQYPLLNHSFSKIAKQWMENRLSYMHPTHLPSFRPRSIAYASAVHYLFEPSPNLLTSCQLPWFNCSAFTQPLAFHAIILCNSFSHVSINNSHNQHLVVVTEHLHLSCVNLWKAGFGILASVLRDTPWSRTWTPCIPERMCEI